MEDLKALPSSKIYDALLVVNYTEENRLDRFLYRLLTVYYDNCLIYLQCFKRSSKKIHVSTLTDYYLLKFIVFLDI